MLTYRQFVIGVLVVCLTIVVFADVPHIISYQGLLTNPVSGEPIPDGAYAVSFNIYDDPLGTTPLWSELYPSLTVTGGLYSVRLGEITPFPTSMSFAVPYWLEVIFDGTAMVPRYQLTSGAYALNIPDEIRKPLGLGIYNPDAYDFSAVDLATCSRGVDIIHYMDSAGSVGGITLEAKEGTPGLYYSIARLGWLSAYEDFPMGLFTNIAVYGEVTSSGSGGAAVLGFDNHGATGGDGDYAGYFAGDVYISGDLLVDGSIPGGECLWTESGAAALIYANNNTNVTVWDSGNDHDFQVTTLSTDAGDAAIYGVQGTTHAGGYPGVASAIWGDADGGYGVCGRSRTSSGVYGYSEVSYAVWGVSQNSDGVFGWSHSASGAGIYGYNNGGGLAGEFDGDVEVDGSFKSNEVIKVTINGCDFKGNNTTMAGDVEMIYQNDASVEVYEASDNQGLIFASIPFPTCLHGNGIRIDSIRVYYQTEETADYIDLTQLRENTFDGSYLSLTLDNTNRTSTTISSYKVTCGDDVDVNTGGVYLFINIYYNGGGTVTIYGAEVYMHQP